MPLTQTVIYGPVRLLVCIVALNLCSVLVVPTSAQDDGVQQLEARQGLKITGVMMDSDGRIFVGPIEIAGQSPDDLFTYWIGRHGGSDYYGYDAYTGTWMPGPVTYQKALLAFQGENVEGWIRVFAGMPDYRRLFGANGRLYERYQNLYSGNQVYTYFVDMTNGERSDAEDILGFLSSNRQWMDTVLEQQRDQADEIVGRSEKLGRDLVWWNNSAHSPPAFIRSFGQALQEIILPESIADQTEPSLLELIEEEIGAMQGQTTETEPADQPAPAE